jgi:pyridoxine 5-phosphate synthase
MARSVRTALSVNVNKVALLRNSRHLGEPSVLRASKICLTEGAHGITVHPRPDQRHIRTTDVFELAELLQEWPDAEYNIEGNPLHNLMEIVRAVRPHQATFVPDSIGQSTSDHGWDLPRDSETLLPLIQECRDLGVRVSLFMDPGAEQMHIAKQIGADRVELYTETWASSYGKQHEQSTLALFTKAAEAALQSDLGVNAGHDLNLHNLRPFVSHVPGVLEVSIGHALSCDSLEMGYAAAVHAYLNCLDTQ